MKIGERGEVGERRTVPIPFPRFHCRRVQSEVQLLQHPVPSNLARQSATPVSRRSGEWIFSSAQLRGNSQFALYPCVEVPRQVLFATAQLRLVRRSMA